MIATLLLVAAAALSPAPTDADIRGILADRLPDERQGVGIVVGVVDESGRRIVSRGVPADAVFEIGSVTKVFTSLLLADAVARGEVALTDPVAKYLPAEVKVPERGGKKITLQDLATHSSGLPRLPANLAPKDPANPYADYTVAQMYEFLSGLTLTRDIGSQYEYSNLGAGLLGHALARRAGMGYEELVRKRILEPLGMNDTFVTVPAKAMPRFAKGHDAELKPAANWDIPTLAGAGALRSTANDLLTFVAANLGLTKTPLSKAMASMTATRRPAAGGQIGLAWHITDRGIVWHNGGTGGYRSFIGFDPKTRVGVVALTNASTPDGVDDIGRHVLDPTMPLAKSRAQLAVGADVLQKYTGRYELAPTFYIDVTREGDHLFAQASGQPRVEIFPETATKFFYKVVDAQITFGEKSLTLHQNGRNVPGRRLEGEIPTRKEMSVAPEVLEKYVGRYELAPGFIITISREGNRLFAQATGQPRFEIFAESERDFFFKVVDAQITFGDKSLVLHQNGDHRARKIE